MSVIGGLEFHLYYPSVTATPCQLPLAREPLKPSLLKEGGFYAIKTGRIFREGHGKHAHRHSGCKTKKREDEGILPYGVH